MFKQPIKKDNIPMKKLLSSFKVTALVTSHNPINIKDKAKLILKNGNSKPGMRSSTKHNTFTIRTE